MNNRIKCSVFSFFIMISLLFGFAAQPVLAAEFNSNGVVGADEVIEDDLFIGAQDVVFDGRVDGNLLASGTVVTINGEVTGSVFAVGKTIIVSETAEIGGDLFAFSSSVIMDGKVSGSVFGGSAALKLGSTAEVERNVYYGGYSLETTAGSQVGIDLFAGVYQALLKGEIERNAKIGAGAVELSGNIGGDAEIDLGTVSPDDATDFSSYMYFPQDPNIPESVRAGLRVAEGAVIGGKLIYSAGADFSRDIKAQPESGIVADFPTPREEIQSAGQRMLVSVLGWFLKLVRRLITLLILGLLAIWLIPAIVKPAAEFVRTSPLPAAGNGVLLIILGSFAIFLAAGILLGLGFLFGLLTLGGLVSVILWLGFSALLLLVVILVLLVTYGSHIVVSYFIGNWFLGLIAPQAKEKGIWAMVIGIIFLVVLSSLPFIGWLVSLVATLIGTGAIVLLFRNRRKALPETQAVNAEIAEG